MEAFPGDTSDPAKLASQVAAVRERGIEARVRQRGVAIRSLVEAGDVEMSLFDGRDLVETTSGAWPGEPMVCRNPLLAENWARKHSKLLEDTGALLEPFAASTRRLTLQNEQPAPDASREPPGFFNSRHLRGVVGRKGRDPRHLALV